MTISKREVRSSKLRLLSNSRLGFTIAELLVAVGVIVLLVLLFTQLLNSAATITTLGHKQMDADSEARQLLDRMAIDFAQMVKRSDVDYFAKGTAAPNSVGGVMAGNDQIAFYSAVPGYYPSSYSAGSQSPVSLVAYRVTSVSGTAAFNKMERLGKGLVWTGVSTTDTPVVFLPLLISNTWPYATNQSADTSSTPAYEIIGPQVFRFEYYYLLKGWTDPTGGTTNASILSSTPWDTRIPGRIAVNGMQDVVAVVVNIAVIDPKSKVLLDNSAQVPPPSDNITRLAASLSDFTSGMTLGQLQAQWRATLDANSLGLPRSAISGIRLYERYFYLSPPTLLTP
jgi:hypothetical protein